MRVNVQVFDQRFPIEALPSDTIWTLKWKIYENEDIRKYCTDRVGRIPSPDDQELVMDDGGTVLTDCERTLESYSIHEGAKLKCRKLCEHRYGEAFRSLLNVYRKKKTEMRMSSSVSFFKHFSIHIHEARSVKLESIPRNHMESFIYILIHSMPSIKELNLFGMIYSIFPHDSVFFLIFSSLIVEFRIMNIPYINFHYFVVG
eukprot:TRINITY_DN313_c0_g1_i9.p1 TRINITY_DN313_c0_g1~~TRINITY_DN313_c0_g1_i9.p1  ORF type:complete len:235 (-),score=33.01 TRINITY_DN313_c0_g1_i9:110-715(-)